MIIDIYENINISFDKGQIFEIIDTVKQIGQLKGIMRAFSCIFELRKKYTLCNLPIKRSSSGTILGSPGNWMDVSDNR